MLLLLFPSSEICFGCIAQAVSHLNSFFFNKMQRNVAVVVLTERAKVKFLTNPAHKFRYPFIPSVYTLRRVVTNPGETAPLHLRANISVRN
jgi:hypothetical protein